MLTIVAVTPAGNGNLRAYPKDAAVPTAVAINYSAGLNLANTTIVPLKQNVGDAFEFTVSANVSNSHLVADVVGYFWAPSATPLDCTTVTGSANVVNGGSWDFQTATCPAGRALTGGGVNWANCGENLWFWQNSPNDSNNAWRTRGENLCGFTAFITAYGRCCQIPGL